MSMTPHAPEVDLHKAMIDPGATFKAPEDVRDHPSLSRDKKIEILKRWQYDAAEDDVAEEEGMATASASLTRRIMLSLNSISTEHGNSPSPPTKHGAR